MTKKWIQQADLKKGALHRQLGYEQSHHIPLGLLQNIKQQGVGSHVRTPRGTVTVTPLLKKRANFALNVRGPR